MKKKAVKANRIKNTKPIPQPATILYQKMPEDMILIAANQALGQAKEISTAEMGKATAGFNLPGLT